MGDVTDQDTVVVPDTAVPGTSESTTPENALLDEYPGEITLRISTLPALQPQVLPTRSSSPWKRFLEAGRQRTFTLTQDFRVDVQGDALPEKLQGCIVIPTRGSRIDDDDASDATIENSDSQHSHDQGELNVFDGASIPFPWIISYISFGVLRPLGILLSASVVHDFAFQFGYLPVMKNGKCKHVPVARHEADELFRLITATLNGSRFFSRLAWHAVRLGYWGIRYAGNKRTGKPPVQSTVLAVATTLVAMFLVHKLRQTWLVDVQGGITTAVAVLGLLATIMGLVYLWITIENFVRKSSDTKSNTNADADQI